MKNYQGIIVQPVVNGLNKEEEARFIALWKKGDATPSEDKEFRRLKFKRWKPDNRNRRIIVAHAQELFVELETLLNLHGGIANGGEGILPKDWSRARALVDLVRGAQAR